MWQMWKWFRNLTVANRSPESAQSKVTLEISLEDAIKTAEDRKVYNELICRMMAKSLSGSTPDGNSSESEDSSVE